MDEETQRQVDDLHERMVATRSIRAAQQRRLYVLQEQAARFGVTVAPEIVTEIADLRGQIRASDGELAEIQRLITRLATAPPSVLVLPDLAPYVPALEPALVDSRIREFGAALNHFRELFAVLAEQMEVAREESKEWRTSETAGRQAGMLAHREQHRAVRIAIVAGGLLLLLLVGAVVALLIRVF